MNASARMFTIKTTGHSEVRITDCIIDGGGLQIRSLGGGGIDSVEIRGCLILCAPPSFWRRIWTALQRPLWSTK